MFVLDEFKRKNVVAYSADGVLDALCGAAGVVNWGRHVGEGWRTHRGSVACTSAVHRLAELSPAL